MSRITLPPPHRIPCIHCGRFIWRDDDGTWLHFDHVKYQDSPWCPNGETRAAPVAAGSAE